MKILADQLTIFVKICICVTTFLNSTSRNITQHGNEATAMMVVLRRLIMLVYGAAHEAMSGGIYGAPHEGISGGAYGATHEEKVVVFMRLQMNE